jgi:pyrroline-5-carboxylate reductase
MRIAFIGGGNIATSLVGGLIARGTPAQDLTVADPVAAQLERLRHEYGVNVAGRNEDAVRDADLVVLAVKPQDMAGVARGIAGPFAARRRVAVSVAAGIRLASLSGWLGGAPALVRAMPNRPALIGAGVTAAVGAPGVEPHERESAGAVLSAVGPVVWLEDESQIDAVTAVSGSGPAYIFLLVEAMEDAGVSLGLPRETARLLAVQTAYGAGRMCVESGELPARLREQVTSKGGTTAAALAVFESADFRGLVQHALGAAARRSVDLAREFGGD